MTALQTLILAVHPHLTLVQVLLRIHPVQTHRLTPTLAPAVLVQTGTGKRNPEVARTEVAGQNRQKMNIAKNRQMRRGQVVRIIKVKKAFEISCKNIWPRLKNAGRRVENNTKSDDFSFLCCIINRLKKYVNKNVFQKRTRVKVISLYDFEYKVLTYL